MPILENGSPEPVKKTYPIEPVVKEVVETLDSISHWDDQKRAVLINGVTSLIDRLHETSTLPFYQQRLTSLLYDISEDLDYRSKITRTREELKKLGLSPQLASRMINTVLKYSFTILAASAGSLTGLRLQKQIAKVSIPFKEEGMVRHKRTSVSRYDYSSNR